METLNKDKKERNYLFDNIKAVLVFFVVSAHYIRVNGSFDPATAGEMYYIIAFSFIMQGFLLVSGYFSKNTEKCRAGGIQEFSYAVSDTDAGDVLLQVDFIRRCFF